jgi:hypothetical protein
MNDQKRLRRSAYRSLFAFFSGRLVSQAKGDLKAGRFSSAFGALGTLFERPGIIFRQPSLLTQVIRHFAV